MHQITVGSVCSGIEAASVSWMGMPFSVRWFSEISDFPSRLLSLRYPNTPNIGDMTGIPAKIIGSEICAPDLICGGTPCQAFSLAGWKKGLEDSRGNLTLKFIEIINANDEVRAKEQLPPSMVLWENVENVLRDKTNAFGCFIASLAGLQKEITFDRWPLAGVVYGPTRNLAWRVLDAKYFGLPQQRRRLYVVAGGKDFHPESIIFERKTNTDSRVFNENNSGFTFIKNGETIEVFRKYTDCLYSAYGTKWNGNAAAYNGSLYVSQNGRLRRFSPLECERLMGFPDEYTNISNAKATNRYQAVGNSWATPVIRWLGNSIVENLKKPSIVNEKGNLLLLSRLLNKTPEWAGYDLSGEIVQVGVDSYLNTTEAPNSITFGDLRNIVDTNVDPTYYISPAGCQGILRRRDERDLSMNPRLEIVLKTVSSMWSKEAIEKVSRVQSRGRFSVGEPNLKADGNDETTNQLNLI